MMARKLAGIFALMAMASYLGSWLWSNRLAGLTAAPVEEAWLRGVFVAIAYWLVGLFLATLGIGLMQEVIAERRSRDIERRVRAKALYDEVMGGDAPVGAAASGGGA